MAGGLDFGLLGARQDVQTADYRSAGSHQAENLNYQLITNTNTWVVIKTVTTGKTFYCSLILIHTTAGPIVQLGAGASGSEVTFFKFVTPSGSLAVPIALPTPIKFSSGTIISGRANTDTDVYFSLIGWEE